MRLYALKAVTGPISSEFEGADRTRRTLPSHHDGINQERRGRCTNEQNNAHHATPSDRSSLRQRIPLVHNGGHRIDLDPAGAPANPSLHLRTRLFPRRRRNGTQHDKPRRAANSYVGVFGHVLRIPTTHFAIQGPGSVVVGRATEGYGNGQLINAKSK